MLNYILPRSKVPGFGNSEDTQPLLYHRISESQHGFVEPLTTICGVYLILPTASHQLEIHLGFSSGEINPEGERAAPCGHLPRPLKITDVPALAPASSCWTVSSVQLKQNSMIRPTKDHVSPPHPALPPPSSLDPISQLSPSQPRRKSQGSFFVRCTDKCLSIPAEPSGKIEGRILGRTIVMSLPGRPASASLLHDGCLIRKRTVLMDSTLNTLTLFVCRLLAHCSVVDGGSASCFFSDERRAGSL